MITTPTGNLVKPGDFAAVKTHGTVSRAISCAEKLASGGTGRWQHALFYAGGPGDLCLEAEPGGALLIPYRYQDRSLCWSTDNPKLDLTDEQRAMAMPIALRYRNTPYAFADYLAIAEHRVLHLPGWMPFGLDYIPDAGLRPVTIAGYMKATWHQICSQLTDQCRLDMGSHLFTDDRLPGDVMPDDIGALILGEIH